MARPADDLPERALLVAGETSTVTDDALAASSAEWLAEFDERPLLQLTVTAA